jgi:hypothetical protein
MTDIHFQTRLSELTQWKGNNDFPTVPIVGTGRFVTDKMPYYFRALRARRQAADELCYVRDSRPFAGRTLTQGRVREIFNGAPIPFTLNFQGRPYVIGKGFIANFSGEVMDILFCALDVKDGQEVRMRNIEFLVKREALENKELEPVGKLIKEAIKEHKGVVSIVPTIEIGRALELPKARSIKEQKEVVSQTIKSAIAAAKQMV